MRSPKILLVDDEESIRLSFRRDFEHEGYLVTTAASGEEAIDILQKNHFDLVISDLSMPGIGGIGVLQETKKQDPEPSVVVFGIDSHFHTPPTHFILVFFAGKVSGLCHECFLIWIPVKHHLFS